MAGSCEFCPGTGGGCGMCADLPGPGVVGVGVASPRSPDDAFSLLFGTLEQWRAGLASGTVNAGEWGPLLAQDVESMLAAVRKLSDSYAAVA